MSFKKPKSIEKSCYIYRDTWSSKNDILPELVSISSNKKYWFNCFVCSHEYEQSPLNKTSGNGCPYCANKLRCGECDKCLKNSCFIYKEEWSDKNKEKCEYVAISSGKKYWFNCLKCSHEYEQTPNKKLSGRGCPYCANQKRCGECERCLNNSCFRYKATWSDNNKEKCECVALNSNKKYWFNCLECSNEYEQSPGDKTNKGRGCPYCVNKTELKVTDFLKEQNIKFESQFKIKNIKKYYDFYLPDFDLILEIDGNQHFKQVSNWCCHEKTINNDIEKMKTGLENSLSFLRIYQPDIWGNKIDWKTTILKNLYKRTLPDISYVSSKTDIYNVHNYIFSCIE
jgi:very-short-patch-repair endonuclease